MIEIENLHKSYGKQLVLNGLNVKIHKGKITAIVGPNGSGKTTLIKCILGLVNFHLGRILINSYDIKRNINYRNLLGYMPQIGKYPENLKPRELMDLLLHLTQRKKISRLDDLISLFRFEPYLDKYVKNLSGGSIQKLSAILAFMFDAEYYILDEPTAGLDPISSVDLKNIIISKRKEGSTFVVVSHQIAEIETFADHIVFILDGKIYIDSPIAVFIQNMGCKNLEEAVINFLNIAKQSNGNIS